MFIVDALLGNFDRHNGNWGFLVNYGTGEVKIAPIFDCGSCLYPQIEEKQMEYVLQDKKEIEKRIFVFPTSAIKVDEMKLNYFDFLNTTDNINCLKSLKDISNKIDMNKINSIIEGTPYISEIHKRFLKTMVRQRKEQIIDKSLERIYDRKEKLKSRYRGYER